MVTLAILPSFVDGQHRRRHLERQASELGGVGVRVGAVGVDRIPVVPIFPHSQVTAPVVPQLILDLILQDSVGAGRFQRQPIINTPLRPQVNSWTRPYGYFKYFQQLVVSIQGSDFANFLNRMNFQNPRESMRMIWIMDCWMPSISSLWNLHLHLRSKSRPWMRWAQILRSNNQLPYGRHRIPCLVSTIFITSVSS